MASNRVAQVWLHGEPVGQITSPAPRGSGLRFAYNSDVLQRYPLNTPLLSCSLPTGTRAVDARAFFAGLLPEGDHRRALSSRAGVLDTDVFALLTAYGQDVAGAVVIGEHVEHRPHAFADPYDEAALAAEVAALSARQRPLAVYDDSELSIAGLQDKMLLVRTRDGGWARPIHGYPSTHILKVDDRMHRGLVVAEHTSLELARAAALPAAASELIPFGDLWTLVVERFDRTQGAQPSDPARRLHQEDACQALGVDLEATQGRSKYEAGGGPSLGGVAQLLSAWGHEDQLLALLDQVVFRVLIGDADAHGKNISLLHPTPGEISLAPLYDTVPTALWPNLRTRAAMSVGAAVEMPQISGSDIVREAHRWGVGSRVAEARVLETAERLVSATSGLTLADDPMAARTIELVKANARRVSAVGDA